MQHIDLTEIIVKPTRMSDREAVISAGPKGTGAIIRVAIEGQRGGIRLEEFALSNHMREQLIRALGGTP